MVISALGHSLTIKLCKQCSCFFFLVYQYFIAFQHGVLFSLNHFFVLDVCFYNAIIHADDIPPKLQSVQSNLLIL